MKKYISYILLFMFILTALGCSAIKKDSSKSPTGDGDEFNSKIATTVAQNYMNYIMSGDMESAKKLYSKEMSEKDVKVIQSNLKILGYKMEEINEVGKSALIKMKVTRSVKDTASASLDSYNIKVSKEDGEYKIKEVGSQNEKEAFNEGYEIRLRQKNNVKTNLLIDMSGVPEFAFPKDDKANISKSPVPKKNFGNINFSYGGDKMAISTYNEDSYVGVVKIDESLAVQGGDSTGGGDTGGGKQGQDNGKDKNKAREMPVGKEIISLDLIKAAKIHYMSFSLDEKFIMVQYEIINKGTTMRVYNVDNGQMIKVDIEKEFPMDFFDVTFYSFDNEVVNFDVKQKGNVTKEQIQKVGRWQIDLKDFKIKKL